MTTTPESLQSLLQRVDERERAARLRALIYSLMPIALAAVLLWYTSQQVQQANQDLSSIQQRLQSSQQELASVNQQLVQAREQVNQSQQQLTAANQQLTAVSQQLAAVNQQLSETKAELARSQQELTAAQANIRQAQAQIEDLKKQLADATNVAKYKYTGDVFVDLKLLATRSPQLGDMMSEMLRLQQQNIPYKTGGNSLTEGFDSPSFAAYMLSRHSLEPPTIVNDRYRLREVLSPTPSPQLGDVTFYESGYVMFNLGTGNQSFVMGMTPLGILALQPKFAPVQGYGHVRYK